MLGGLLPQPCQTNTIGAGDAAGTRRPTLSQKRLVVSPIRISRVCVPA